MQGRIFPLPRTRPHQPHFTHELTGWEERSVIQVHLILKPHTHWNRSFWFPNNILRESAAWMESGPPCHFHVCHFGRDFTSLSLSFLSRVRSGWAQQCKVRNTTLQMCYSENQESWHLVFTSVSPYCVSLDKSQTLGFGAWVYPGELWTYRWPCRVRLPLIVSDSVNLAWVRTSEVFHILRVHQMCNQGWMSIVVLTECFLDLQQHHQRVCEKCKALGPSMDIKLKFWEWIKLFLQYPYASDMCPVWGALGDRMQPWHPIFFKLCTSEEHDERIR